MDEDEKKEQKKRGKSKADGKRDKGESSKAKKVRKEKKERPKTGKRKDGDVEIVEAGEMVPRIKPKLDDETRNLLALRKERKSDKPEFLRQEWYRYGRVGMKWRRPRGLHSKMRRHFKRRINVVSIGYGSPAKVRSLHSSGFQERLVHNVNDLEALDPKTQAARIAHSVGTRKRLDIIRSADDLGIRVLNRGVKREAKPQKEKKARKEEEEKDIEIEETEAGEELDIEDGEEPAIEDNEEDTKPEEKGLGGEEEADETSDKERNKGGGAQGGENSEKDEGGMEP